MFDLYLAAIVGGIAVGIVDPRVFAQLGSTELLVLAILFAWVFVEAFLLSTTGTTPGKWLFKTHLVPPSGGKASYSLALSRSINVWWRGLGIGFPIVSLITLIVAHRKLSDNGVTTWDKEFGFTVIHDRIGPVRITVAVLAFAVYFILVAIGSATNA